MEKILRESNEGILVYIAPTKALVTQVAAEIYARFSKDLNGRKYSLTPSNEGRLLIQLQVAAGRYILVIPGFMIHRIAKYLSPSLRFWRSCFYLLYSLRRGPPDSNSMIINSRLVYFLLTSYCSVILDEIHTIGQQEGGAVWEQILLLSPCPIMYVTFTLISVMY